MAIGTEIKCDVTEQCRSYPKKCVGCLKNGNYKPDYFESDKAPDEKSPQNA